MHRRHRSRQKGRRAAGVHRPSLRHNLVVGRHPPRHAAPGAVVGPGERPGVPRGLQRPQRHNPVRACPARGKRWPCGTEPGTGAVRAARRERFVGHKRQHSPPGAGCGAHAARAPRPAAGAWPKGLAGPRRRRCLPLDARNPRRCARQRACRVRLSPYARAALVVQCWNCLTAAPGRAACHVCMHAHTRYTAHVHDVHANTP